MLFVQANVVLLGHTFVALGFLVQILVDLLVVCILDLEFLVEDAAIDNQELLLQAFADHGILVHKFVELVGHVWAFAVLVFLVQAFASCDQIPDTLGHVLGDCE